MVLLTFNYILVYLLYCVYLIFWKVMNKVWKYECNDIHHSILSIRKDYFDYSIFIIFIICHKFFANFFSKQNESDKSLVFELFVVNKWFIQIKVLADNAIEFILLNNDIKNSAISFFSTATHIIYSSFIQCFQTNLPAKITLSKKITRIIQHLVENEKSIQMIRKSIQLFLLKLVVII